MSRRIRRKFTATFKAQVAMEAVKENQTMAELAMRFDLSAAQISLWKKHLAQNAAGVFECSAPTDKSDDQDLDRLFAEIGRLKMENDLLKKMSR